MSCPTCQARRCFMAPASDLSSQLALAGNKVWPTEALQPLHPSQPSTSICSSQTSSNHHPGLGTCKGTDKKYAALDLGDTSEPSTPSFLQKHRNPWCLKNEAIPATSGCLLLVKETKKVTSSLQQLPTNQEGRAPSAGKQKTHTQNLPSHVSVIFPLCNATEQQESPKHPAHKRRKAGLAQGQRRRCSTCPKYKQVQTLSLMEIKWGGEGKAERIFYICIRHFGGVNTSVAPVLKRKLSAQTH